MASVGVFLRELRARRGVSLEEIARKTRVASRYLEALEADAYDQLPAPVFVRGFIRAYCQTLGEPPEEALACYDGVDGRVPPAAVRPAPLPRAGSADPRTRGTIIVSFVLLVVLGMALFTVALVLRPRDRAATADLRSDLPATPMTEPMPSMPPAASPPAAPSATASRPPVPPASPQPPTVARPAAPPATPSGPLAARPPTPVAPFAPTPPANASTPPGGAPAATAPGLEGLAGSVKSPYRLVARTYETTWIRVRTEDGRTSEETLPAGEIREWLSDRPFVVTIGNAGGVALELNGRTLPPLGGKGVVIQRLVLPPSPR
jgi:cytoskeleton protein RodZ